MPLTATASRTYNVRAAATLNDGRHGVELLEFTVRFASDPELLPDHDQAFAAANVGPASDRWEQVTEWVESYLQDRDLTGTLHFAPTPRQLALYLARVASSIDPSLVHCTVTAADGEAFTVEYS